MLISLPESNGLEEESPITHKMRVIGDKRLTNGAWRILLLQWKGKRVKNNPAVFYIKLTSTAKSGATRIDEKVLKT